MKKIYLSLSLILSSMAGFSQLSIMDLVSGMPAAPSYTITMGPDNAITSHDFDIHNDYANSVTVKVKRYIINSPGHDIYYCFGANCYSANGSAFFNPTQTSTIAAGGMLPNGQGTFGLKTDFEDLGIVGNSKVLYVLYDVNNVNDSVAVEMNYEVATVGLSKIDAKNFMISNPMPNPAVNSVALKYNFNALPKTSFVKIYNMVGVLVKEIKIDGVEGKTQVDVSSLTDGVYFYSLIVNDKVVSTKRLIVSK